MYDQQLNLPSSIDDEVVGGGGAANTDSSAVGDCLVVDGLVDDSVFLENGLSSLQSLGPINIVANEVVDAGDVEFPGEGEGDWAFADGHDGVGSHGKGEEKSGDQGSSGEHV